MKSILIALLSLSMLISPVALADDDGDSGVVEIKLDFEPLGNGDYRETVEWALRDPNRGGREFGKNPNTKDIAFSVGAAYAYVQSAKLPPNEALDFVVEEYLKAQIGDSAIMRNLDKAKMAMYGGDEGSFRVNVPYKDGFIAFTCDGYINSRTQFIDERSSAYIDANGEETITSVDPVYIMFTLLKDYHNEYCKDGHKEKDKHN